ncbi:MAG: SLBB domain-containing protein, partial [Bacteroides sp.]|nr:SLBB domain-containing protein [Bacteroides sp.]
TIVQNTIVQEMGDPTLQIFGHNIFTAENLTFEPNSNIATPTNYRLGPGDEVIIDIWGNSQDLIRQTISPEGTIQVNTLGPLYLNGRTVKEATNYLKQKLATIYADSQINLSLGDTRSIQVNVMGEVKFPGTYMISSFSSVFHALYSAGGVNDIGSLRSIKVMRNGKVFANLDVYNFIMQGKFKDDIRLQDGDVVLVDPYESLIQITGKVKRPMFYEMKPTETVSTLLDYAGGFTGDAYKKAVRIVRKSGREYQIYNVDEIDFSVFRLADGDVLSVDSILQRFENRVEIRGAVYREGLYQLNGTVNTVKQLIKKAEGVRGDAFLNRAILDREREDLTHEIIPIDVKGLLNGIVADIPLQKNDVLYIPSIHDLKEEQTLTIHGEVAFPGTYAYSDNMSIEDIIIQAGGLLETASAVKIEIARRVKDPKSTSFSTIIGQTYSFDLKDGFLIGDKANNFSLQPFDEVYVRKSPAYFAQQNVTISGEVMFDGVYSLQQKNERLSDVVSRAGGVTPDAYVKGARLVRQMNEEERRRQADVLRMARSGEEKDSISIEKLDMGTTYAVGIDLEKALENPGSDYDLVLREGDQLYIPEYVNTVKISGSVMYPNTVLYKDGKKLKHYVNLAGGYGADAKKSKAYVIYMNGTVAKLSKYKSSLIQPGCEIVIPSKPESKKMSVAEVMSIGTTSASLATMIASMVNLFK